MKNYSNTIICPVGKEFSTVKSHAAGCAKYFYVSSQKEEDDYLANALPIYTEVSKEDWVMFALNAKSMNVPSFVGAGLPDKFTLWRSSRPDFYYATNTYLDEEVGKESPGCLLTTDADFSFYPKGLHFRPLPWIFAGWGLNQPNPAAGYRNFLFDPACYILDGKFYIGANMYPHPSHSDEKVVVSGKTCNFSLHHVSPGLDFIENFTFVITSTFYDI